MFDLLDLQDAPPFSLSKEDKAALFVDALHDLTRHHHDHCSPYRKILKTLGFDPNIKHTLEEMPFVPVRLFKDFDLFSIKKSEIFKTMTSSGTSGQNVSKIFLDRKTAAHQTKVLAKIVGNFIGGKRLPMLIVDSKSVLKDQAMFSARGAGILGFSMLGRDVTYALDGKMELDNSAVEAFCRRHQGEKILVFGFTFMVWEHLYKKLIQNGKRFPLENGILIHGGGWKKLSEQAVGNDEFKRRLREICGISQVHNYYGMVEQTGSIFMECEAGFLHSSIFSDVVIRNTDFSVCGLREAGLVELLSLLPESYPGHIILSEDIGEIVGEDDCSCGRLGKYFKIHGRLKNAEVRGCSDTAA